MHQHTCPRCARTFHSYFDIEGLICGPCTAVAGSAEWADVAPTKPREVIPLAALAIAARTVRRQ